MSWFCLSLLLFLVNPCDSEWERIMIDSQVVCGDELFIYCYYFSPIRGLLSLLNAICFRLTGDLCWNLILWFNKYVLMVNAIVLQPIWYVFDPFIPLHHNKTGREVMMNALVSLVLNCLSSSIVSSYTNGYHMFPGQLRISIFMMKFSAFPQLIMIENWCAVTKRWVYIIQNQYATPRAVICWCITADGWLFRCCTR